MNSPAKGTVTPIASLFSAEETRKAASYVEEKINEKRGEMNRLQQFVDENDNLISLVKKLPDQLHHNVMVPFGKIAFFPGRLIHTNECLVLLGENYYTDRTSKQTIEVLKRRGKTLQSQIHSLKAEIQDFQTEASFFSATASEAAEGLVEIREEYVEEDSSASVLPSSEKEPSGLTGGETADDDFARIMSRLNELEIEEEQEECDDGDDRDEAHDSPIESVEESEHDMVKGIRSETDDDRITYGKQESDISVPKKASGHSSSSIHEPEAQWQSIKPEAQWRPKGDQSSVGIPQQNAGTLGNSQATSTFPRAEAKTNVVGPQKIESPRQKPEPEFDNDTNKAFTGSILERPGNLDINTQGQMQSQPSKPVSRFKAQRR